MIECKNSTDERQCIILKYAIDKENGDVHGGQKIQFKIY